jgi:hypothetical protein
MKPGGDVKTVKIVLLAAIWLSLPVISTADAFSIGGYYKSFFMASNFPRLGNPRGENIEVPDQGAVINRLRLNVGAEITNTVHLNASYDMIPRVDDYNSEAAALQSLTAFNDNSLSYRVDDLDLRLYPSPHDHTGSFYINQNLDRLNISLALPFADVIIGRQPVAWGSARVINPTDVIAPYAYQELDTEDRVGVDAARVRIPLGFMGEIDAGYVAGYKARFENSAAFLRGKYYIAKTDVSALVVGFRENLMVGFDLARSVGGAGAWAEGAYVFHKALSENKRNGDYDYFRLSVGTDYSLTGELYGFLEYHFNGAGTSGADEYGSLAFHPAYTDGAVYLFGRHYLTPGASYQLTPLITLTGEALCNLNDPSAFLSLQAEYNIAENVYLSAGAFIGIGDNPELVYIGPLPAYIALNSEFGSYSDILFSSFRFYF